MAVQAQLFPENLGFPIGGSQDWVVDYARGGAFGQFCCSLATADGGGHGEKQKQEIDYYIKSQNESLRQILREQSRQQLSTLLKRIELKTAIMMRDKEEEIARAAKKTMELEIFLRKLESENQAWQRIAQESEAMAMSLNNTLDQMRERCENGVADDAESCCDMNEEHELTMKKTMMICRSCNSRKSCVIFLPCRHLCSCKDCEQVLDCCPVCRMAKKAMIEALNF